MPRRSASAQLPSPGPTGNSSGPVLTTFALCCLCSAFIPLGSLVDCKEMRGSKRIGLRSWHWDPWSPALITWLACQALANTESTPSLLCHGTLYHCLIAIMPICAWQCRCCRLKRHYGLVAVGLMSIFLSENGTVVGVRRLNMQDETELMSWRTGLGQYSQWYRRLSHVFPKARLTNTPTVQNLSMCMHCTQ